MTCMCTRLLLLFSRPMIGWGGVLTFYPTEDDPERNLVLITDYCEALPASLMARLLVSYRMLLTCYYSDPYPKLFFSLAANTSTPLIFFVTASTSPYFILYFNLLFYLLSSLQNQTSRFIFSLCFCTSLYFSDALTFFELLDSFTADCLVVYIANFVYSSHVHFKHHNHTPYFPSLSTRSTLSSQDSLISLPFQVCRGRHIVISLLPWISLL